MNFLVLIGVVIFAAGVALIVQGIQGRRASLQTYGGGAVLLGIVVAVASYAFVVIPAGHVGVVFNVFGGVQDEELGEGFHLVLPFVQRVTRYDIRQHELTLAVETRDQVTARSSEGLEINVDVTVLYQPYADQVARLHQDIGPDYEAVRLRPEMRTQIRDGIAEYAAAEMISTLRTDLQQSVEERLRLALDEDNIRVLSVLLRDVRIPESITTAIEEKQAAEQQIEVEENRRRQSEIAAQRRVIEAEGERDAEIARAEGQAQALRLRGESIREHPEIIQLEVAQKLSPSIQTIMMPSDNNFLLDLRNVVGSGAPGGRPGDGGSATGQAPAAR